ncbi:DNA binding methylated-DNA-(protein)-cysteine S-methyltransferase [Arthrobacter crystallopoietes BAB-32]|uniref:DNA binding methylated-DNA-(Protein)-cysteine S-methyltransferase n=2 Tax=Crystallibacter crystallopoietes TaxID=37928 RepID=N1VBD7_9MICC|nr:DNA binding methylated-DNA-(protein)-cysteine S-methyltransferase [Arthrobacter crystallopoietes BAB-32]
MLPTVSAGWDSPREAARYVEYLRAARHVEDWYSLDPKVEVMRPDFVDAVLEVASMVPPGKVLTYGDVAELLGTGGPRQVGSVMARFGSGTPWWRIVRADGTLPRELVERASQQYGVERTPLIARYRSEHGAGRRVDMHAARWLPARGDIERMDVLGRKLSEPTAGMEP